MKVAVLWVLVMAQYWSVGRGETDLQDQPCECMPVYRCQFSTLNEGLGSINIRLDRKGCSGVLDICCPTTMNRSPTPNVQLTCGTPYISSQLETRITADDQAQYGKYPWMAALLNNGRKYLCGGSLIHPQVVLTAAHCVDHIRTEDLTVRLGEWDSQGMTEPLPVQNVGAREIVVHEQFRSDSLFNDIALVFLESQPELGGSVRTICLPEPNEIMDGRRCEASGWGKDAFGGDGRHSAILKSVELSIVPREECLQALRETKLGEFFRLHISFLCAGGEEGKDTCKGDGGGPLACSTQQNSTVYVQAGIVSWGINCGQQAPAAYTNVALFRSWIDLQLLRHGLSI